MQADDHAELVAGPPERVPVLAVEAGHAELLWVLGPGDGPYALSGDAAHLGGHELGVPVRDQRQRDEPARVRPCPLLDVPVVVGLQGDQRQVLVLGVGEDLTAELRERREAQRRQDAAGVHVVDAGVDVEAAVTDLAEAGRLDAVLLLGATRHGVEAEVRDLGALEEPHLVAGVVLDHPRRAVGVLRRQAALEHVGRLD